MKPLVTDASDLKQVKEAEKIQKFKLSQKNKDLVEVLSTPAGRRVMWALLVKAGVFESVWENSAKIHYKAGQQDFGHQMMADIVEAGEQFFFLMMTENRKDRV